MKLVGKTEELKIWKTEGIGSKPFKTDKPVKNFSLSVLQPFLQRPFADKTKIIPAAATQ